jgi:integrase
MLTEQAAKSATVPRRKPRVLWDRGAVGLGLKVTPRGRRIWILQLRYPGSKTQSRRTLGDYPELGLEAARKKAKEWYSSAKAGVDPTAAEDEKRRQSEAQLQAAAAQQAHTFSAFAESYIARRNGRRAQVDAQEIRRLLISEWAAQPIGDIKPLDVRKLIDKHKEKSPYTARAAWTHSVGVFKAAVHEQKLTASPCASLDRRELFRNAKIEHRQRVLSDDELFALWRAAGRLRYPAGPFYQLLLLTGVRLSELAKARWRELHPELRRLSREAEDGQRIDWAAVADEVKIWTVPRERFKSDREHVVPLTNEALAIVETLPRFARSDYLFTFDGEMPASLGDYIKRRLDARMLRTLRALARRRGDYPATVTLPHWVNHDLRRVVRSHLSALQVQDHIAEMVIGHGRKGVQRIYDQHRYGAEIREALQRWAVKLRGIVAPSAPSPPARVIALPVRRRR